MERRVDVAVRRLAGKPQCLFVGRSTSRERIEDGEERRLQSLPLLAGE
jgi:hypothetical protein